MKGPGNLSIRKNQGKVRETSQFKKFRGKLGKVMNLKKKIRENVRKIYQSGKSQGNLSI